MEMLGDRNITAMRVVVAVTGASGAIYARQLLERLAASAAVERIALIVSRNGEAVAKFERQTLPTDRKSVV